MAVCNLPSLDQQAYFLEQKTNSWMKSRIPDTETWAEKLTILSPPHGCCLTPGVPVAFCFLLTVSCYSKLSFYIRFVYQYFLHSGANMAPEQFGISRGHKMYINMFGITRMKQLSWTEATIYPWFKVTSLLASYFIVHIRCSDPVMNSIQCHLQSLQTAPCHAPGYRCKIHKDVMASFTAASGWYTSVCAFKRSLQRAVFTAPILSCWKKIKLVLTSSQYLSLLQLCWCLHPSSHLVLNTPICFWPSSYLCPFCI